MQYYKGKLPNSQTRPKQDKRNQIKQKNYALMLSPWLQTPCLYN